MARKAVSTNKAPKAIGPYVQAVDAGDLVFCSGQIALDPGSQELVGGSVGAETDRVIRNLAAVLEAAGLGLADVVRTTVYMTDLGAFEEMNRVYAGYFSDQPPARAAVQVAALPKGARVEIDAIARRP